MHLPVLRTMECVRLDKRIPINNNLCPTPRESPVRMSL